MAQQQTTTQLAVIGAGPGGYGAAFMAADLGLEATVIDPEENPGGVCLYRGCIPTKALLHACKLVRETRMGEKLGIRFTDPTVDTDKLRGWKDQVVRKLTGGLGQLCKQRKISYRRGTARFLDPHKLEIREHDGGRSELSFEHAIVATGAAPVAIGGLSFDSPHVLDSRKALQLDEIPERLLVVGGGYIGLELGSVYAVLGSRVTLVEMTGGLMPGADRDLINSFMKQSGELFETVYLNTTAMFEEQDNGVKVEFKGEHEKDGPARFDKVLLTVGRRPNVESLGLENTGVEQGEKGFIQVDGQRRTTEPSIYAIGDVAGAPLLAHKATHEGRVAAEVIAGHHVAYEPRAMPAVEYTDPEVAWCGLTETEAREQGKDVTVTKFPWTASGRAATLGHADGLTKLVLDSPTGRVLGVGIVGTQAGELISEGALAVEMAATASDIANTIHPHPTLSETLMEAAEAYEGTATSYYRPKREQKERQRSEVMEEHTA